MHLSSRLVSLRGAMMAIALRFSQFWSSTKTENISTPDDEVDTGRPIYPIYGVPTSLSKQEYLLRNLVAAGRGHLIDWNGRIPSISYIVLTGEILSAVQKRWDEEFNCTNKQEAT
jgi:hypothetical protein